MTRAALLEVLREIALSEDDQEVAHIRADSALLEYINDPLVDEAYSNISKWYA